MAEQLLLFWQFGERSDAAKLAHRAFKPGGASFVIRKHQLAFPEPEGAMILERRHAAQYSLVHKSRELPFDGFFHLRTTGVDHFSQVLEDRSGKLCGFDNVGIYTRIFFSHIL